MYAVSCDKYIHLFFGNVLMNDSGLFGIFANPI